MKPQFHIWPEAISTDSTGATLAAHLELKGCPRATLWYRIPPETQTWLSPNSDPFVVATLLMAMSRASAVVIHGEVSPTLLRNLETLQEIWHAWFPSRYYLISMKAEEERELASLTADRLAVSSFSGGVDSSYTVARHRRSDLGRQQEQLTTGLMVQGLDIPLVATDEFAAAAHRGQRILNSVDMTLLPLATNWRDVVQVPWEHGFGMAVAAALMAVQGHFQVGLIASGRSYDRLKFPWGSTPLTDRYCSSGRFEVRHDGAMSDRLAKIHALTDWPEALENLRVCWQGAQKDRNCCRCEKCVRTLLAFRVLGCEQPGCFPESVSPSTIRKLRLRGNPLDEMALVYARAQAMDPDADWVKALAMALQRNRLINRIDRQLPESLKRRLRSLRKG